MPRRIILPRTIDTRLQELTSLVEETNGVLFYPRGRNDKHCPIEGIYITGVGSSGNVQSAHERIDVVNRFLNTNTGYGFVKFHTHTLATIRQYGVRYAREFSHGDIEGIKDQIKYNKEFIAMLVTPEMRLLSGIDNPELQIVEYLEDYEKRHEFIDASLRKIANVLGAGNERLRGGRLS